MNFQSGVVGGTTFYVDGVLRGSSYLITVVNQLSNVVIGWVGTGGSYGGSILIAGISNRVWTPAEHAEYYQDYRRQGWVLDLPRKVTYSYPKTPANCVLDTDFGSEMAGGVRRIRDLAGNYPGTITGVVVPGPGGDGATLVAATSGISHGNVTQQNSVASFTHRFTIDLPVGTIADSYIATRYSSASNYYIVGPDGGGAINPKSLGVRIGNGASLGVGQTQAAQYLRGGTTAHVVVVFNGAGATNADRLKVYVNGDLATLTFAGTIPAAFGDLSGANFTVGYNPLLGNATIATHRDLMLVGQIWTAAQARTDYLKNFAQRVVLRETLEDVPVTLGTSSTSLGPSLCRPTGTWKISEDATGKRYLECVTAGTVVMPVPPSIVFGTLQFTLLHQTDATDTYVMFNASLPAAWNATGQNGYVLRVRYDQKLVFDVVTNGAQVLDLTFTANNYVVSGTPYRYTINRRPSDGRFTSYIKGGLYTADTLISVAGGGGANPSLGNTTYVDTKWFCLSLQIGDKLLGYDPADKRVALFTAWQGVLDPTVAGELPNW